MNLLTVFTYIITLAAIVGTIANALQKCWSFIVWGITNTFWIAYWYIGGEYASACLYLFNLIIAVIGFINWTKTACKNKPQTPDKVMCIAGNFLGGQCPQCHADVYNFDGRSVGSVLYCSACGQLIQFPPPSPAINGVKSVAIDEYLDEKIKEVKSNHEKR